MRTTFVIGIAGGSGSGKSTVAVALCKKYPNSITLLQVDDYFKNKEQVPVLNGKPNWEHPDALRLNDLYHDIMLLRGGYSVTLLTKSELYNPNFDTTLQNKIEYTIQPKPILIVEGFFTLWDAAIRSVIDYGIYLDIPIEESIKRRSANKFKPSAEYIDTVLIPMHNQFIAPTRNYADLVVDTAHTDCDGVLQEIEHNLLRQPKFVQALQNSEIV